MTLRVLLCLCLWVLSSAAPSAKNVRWCVTSDIEEQKCNDLVTSCHVDEILLTCVKKSSSEDCVRAISNGEADAISLDSKDVYKASLHPFNLKPIMTEAYSEREHTPCMRHRQNVLGGKKIRIGAFVPKCEEKGNYAPKQCHGSTGYCWCLNENGEEIEGTRTPPGTKHLTCEDTAPLTLHYAVAVVKKSSTFQLDQLKGKRSCHSAVGEAAGWVAPLDVVLKKNLLSWEGRELKTIEKVASEIFSASCAPGAQEANLCEQCAGQEDKCTRGAGEPYYGDEGAFRCLRDGKGDVAFVADTVLSGQYSDNFELLCPDNTRRPLSQYKICNFGRIPRHAVVTRSSGDKMKDITEYLLQAQKKECKLFSSTHGKDLLFEDTTSALIALPSAMDTYLFLGQGLFNGMKTLEGAHPPRVLQEIRWCPQSKNEKKKCDDWSSVSGGAIKCTEPSSALGCIEMILRNKAEAVAIDVENMHTALKCGLVPSVDEYYNKDDLIPCQIPGSEYSEFGTFRVVALVKKEDKEITWNNLEGKKSCHTGVGHMAGWHIPISLIHKKSKNCDIGSYFSQSCAPGSPIDSNLCKLCIGDPQNTKANTTCSLSDKEAYYGNKGAVRCLVEKGDVAFVLHTAVYENTDGKNTELWAKDLKSTDFELLCPDGSRAPVSDYKKCHLIEIPPQSIFTRPESLRDVVRITLNQQSLYGRKGFQKDIFQLFSSSHGQNLLFSDRTQCLVEFDRMLDRDIMDDVISKPLYKVLYKDNNCLANSALASACSFHQ
ncbi:saxiphilin-like isoform X4 [Ranitomeya variabilis]|uniref:saxiphilin-like isoform X4 n=1 Tax=Ranitomeya variabilis TaxID=490064 RepID=UPI004055EE62